MKALILSGGGARGAYQAGALLAIAEIAAKVNMKAPFKIYTGVSAGAINSSYMASSADDILRGAQSLVDLWSGLTSEKVFKTDGRALGKLGLSWVSESLGGSLSSVSNARSLLDTTPLFDLIRNNLEFHRIGHQIQNGHLHALAITALDYNASKTVTFVDGVADAQMWTRARRVAVRAKINANHVIASSAIPMLFSPGKVGDRYYGDGCVRNQMPLSPAIHLGAKELLVIGVRKMSSIDEEAMEETDPGSPPSVARIVNVLLNSVLLDAVEVDIERLRRINSLLENVPPELHDKLNISPVEYVSVHPSQDIGNLASKMSSRLPRIVRYLLKGLGPLDDAAEIISYLMFEPEFCVKLIEFGYADAKNKQSSIETFLLRPSI